MYKKLSVLIPVYNEKDTIKTCVESVLNADIKDMELEVIISDNNSNDGTKEILNSFDNKKIKILFRKQNNGKGANIKNALNEATGDLILFPSDIMHSVNVNVSNETRYSLSFNTFSNELGSNEALSYASWQTNVND